MQNVPANLQQPCTWADSRSFPPLSWPILPECIQTVPSVTSRLMRWTPPSGGWQLSFLGAHCSPRPQMPETCPTLAYNTRRGVGKAGEHPLAGWQPPLKIQTKPLRVGSICLQCLPWRIHTAAPPSLPLVPMFKWRFLLFDRFSEVDHWWYTHVHTHTVEYHSAIEKNETLPLATRWMDLEDITPSEISQRLFNITYVCNRKNKYI